MKKETKYKVAITVLSLVIILQWIFLPVRKPRKPPKIIPVAVKAKIAIVLDDWGYNLNNLAALKQIKYPLTCSVLPNLSYSPKVARELNASGFQVILHLPMEPHEKYRLEKNTIRTSQEEPAIRGIIKQGLKSVVYAKGVSNHMGSSATEDSRVMEAVFRELKKRQLFFLDSFVTPNSVCEETAGKIGLRFAIRDVFLDNKADRDYIKGQIYKLKAKASARGEAIGIGHDRKATIEVLKEMMPQLEKEGYKFVFISELVK